MAENIDININATGNATRVLAQLDKQVDGLNSSFAGLRRAVAGLGLAAFTRSAFQLADGIDDISKATGIATENVIGFGAAIAANGGTIDGANNSLTKLSQTLGDDTNVNKYAITSFNEVGVSLNDLATLSEQDILAKVVEGLGKITDKSTQARLSTDLLGKSIKGVDFSGVAAGYQQAIKNAEQYASSNKAAADANQSLQAVVLKLQQELLKTLEPINRLVASIDATSETFMRVFNAIKYAAAALASLFLIGKVIKLWQGLTAAVRIAITNLNEFFFGIILI